MFESVVSQLADFGRRAARTLSEAARSTPWLVPAAVLMLLAL